MCGRTRRRALPGPGSSGSLVGKAGRHVALPDAAGAELAVQMTNPTSRIRKRAANFHDMRASLLLWPRKGGSESGGSELTSHFLDRRSNVTSGASPNEGEIQPGALGRDRPGPRASNE